MTAAAQELWAKLAAAGVTAGEMPDADDAQTPWYVRVMLGIAGLIAAVFLLGFVALGLAFVVQNKTASVAVGLMVITASYAIFRMAPRNDFTSMFALAVSIAGQALVVFGIFGLFERNMRGGEPWALIAAIEAVLAIVMPNFIHRVASAYAAGLAFSFACELSGIRGIAMGVLAAAIAYGWLNEARLALRHSVVSPIGYGLTLAFIQIDGTAYFGHSMTMLFGSRPHGEILPWIGEALAVAAWLSTVFVLLKRSGWALGESKSIVAVIAAAAIGFASFKAPGIAGGLMIVVLGFSNGNRVLAGLGIAALLFYVSGYYYFLDTTLLVKSGVLLATGTVLLAVRWLVLNAIMPKAGADA